MGVNPLAGQPAPRSELVNLPKLMSAYYALVPDVSQPGQRVAFGTSGHRGGSLKSSFNESHILAISQAIADYRKQKGINGPLFVGQDTHALSESAMITAVEVFAANDLTIVLAKDGEFTPTPVISHAILSHNRKGASELADGVVITPSHNPPQDGGFKYNPPNGGPADTDVTGLIQDTANRYLEQGLQGVKRLAYQKAVQAPGTQYYDYITPYVNDLEQIIEFEPIRKAGLKLGVDPLGGSGVNYWEHIARAHGLNIELVSREVDPAFGFMTLDWDGKIRMDCSSPYAMARLIGLKDSYDLAFGNDPDYDRHGIVTPKGGLMNPNHFLSVAVWYLFRHRPLWRHDAKVGKTLVSSSMIDRVAAHIGREVAEVPVGFKWFVSGLLDGSYGFGGEESAGASFLRKNGEAWSTDKDGIIMDLLAAEITAEIGRDPAEIFEELCGKFGLPYYERIDAAASPARKKALSSLSPEMITAESLAGEKIIAKLSKAPANQAPIGGVKVMTENGWFAARPSGTEDVYKIYAESFLSQEHLGRIQDEAKAMVDAAFAAAGV